MPEGARSMANPEIIANNPDIVGENPLWDPSSRRLYWTDNRSRRVYSLDAGTSAPAAVVEDWQVYAFTIERDGALLLFMDRTRIAEARPGEPPKLLVDGLPGERDARFNDVVADSRGRVLAGVIPPEGGTGAVYSISAIGAIGSSSAIGSGDGVSLLAGDLEMPNGMAFSPDHRLLYVAETRGKRISLFDYDPDSGAASNRRIFIDLAAQEGASPDGLAVDAEGCLWVALSGGWSVIRFDPSGAEIDRARFPARKITSVGFGGDDMRDAYVTSSSRQAVPGEEIGPSGGALFAFRADVQGLPEHRSAVR